MATTEAPKPVAPRSIEGFQLARDAGKLWLEYNAFSHAGALAFFTLFSLAPTLVIVAAVLGLVLGESAAQGEIAARLQDAIGVGAAQAIEHAVLMSRVETTGLMPSLLGIGAVVVGATTVFTQLRFSLNTIWGVYFSALILLLGAAFTRMHLQARGKPVVPRKSAVRVMQEFVRESP